MTLCERESNNRLQDFRLLFRVITDTGIKSYDIQLDRYFDVVCCDEWNMERQDDQTWEQRRRYAARTEC